MSNDRMLIQCRCCEHYILWGKYYPSTGPYGWMDFKEHIGRFLERHLDSCYARKYMGPELEHSLFGFTTESAFAAKYGGMRHDLWEKRRDVDTSVTINSAADIPGAVDELQGKEENP